MAYRVVWRRRAKRQLASIWLEASNRGAVTTAQAAIDRLLQTDPLRMAQVVSEGLYAIQVRPLRVFFEVSEPDLRVSVVSVGWLP